MGQPKDRRFVLSSFLFTSHPAYFRHQLTQESSSPSLAVLAFGFDEEIGGPQGASAIGEHLLDTYGKNGVAMIVDEGGAGVETLYGKTFVLPGTGEKGNVSPSILVETAGGHS
jgi:acetylornithine deacetylase/succinyl-diaminopimelate desuccinylase-like protein